MKRCSLNNRTFKQEPPYLLSSEKINLRNYYHKQLFIFKILNSSEVSNFLHTLIDSYSAKNMNITCKELINHLTKSIDIKKIAIFILRSYNFQKRNQK